MNPCERNPQGWTNREVLILLLLGVVISFFLAGCSTYRENSLIYKEDGYMKHEVTVTHRTFLMSAEAAVLKTSTQTEDFVRDVNAISPKQAPDAESIKAITEGITSAIIKVFSPVPAP